MNVLKGDHSKEITTNTAFWWMHYSECTWTNRLKLMYSSEWTSVNANQWVHTSEDECTKMNIL